MHIGLFGFGIWGRNIARDLVGLGCRVTAVDPVVSRCDLQGVTLVASSGDLPEVDGLVVATPATTHHDVICRLSDRMVPIFCEKPLTTDPGQARELQRLFSGRLFVMHIWRYHPGVKALSDIAQSGELGEVQALKSVRTNWTSPRRDTDSLWTLVPHDLTLALAILGEIPSPRSARVERVHGRITGINALLGDAPWFSFESSNRYADRRREVRLHCSAGGAVLNDGAHQLEIYRDDAARPVHTRRPFDKTSALEIELKTFVEFLSGGPPPPTDLNEGVAVVEMIDQLKQMAELADVSRE